MPLKNFKQQVVHCLVKFVGFVVDFEDFADRIIADTDKFTRLILLLLFLFMDDDRRYTFKIFFEVVEDLVAFFISFFVGLEKLFFSIVNFV